MAADEFGPIERADEFGEVEPVGGPKTSRSGPSALRASALGLSQGGTFGHADELASILANLFGFAKPSALPGAAVSPADRAQFDTPSGGELLRNRMRAENAEAKNEHPWLYGGSELGGGMAATYAGGKVLQAGARLLPGGAELIQGFEKLPAAKRAMSVGGILGALGAAGATTASPFEEPGRFLEDVGPTTLGSMLFAGGLSKAAPYLGSAARYTGNKLQDLAGWLKVNSIHPTPALGEAMEGIPGGVPATGRALLERWIGGLTKSGTAKQIDAAFKGAGSVADRLAETHDVAGAPVDLADALTAARSRADELMAEPATREAASKLRSLISDYAEKYGAGDSAPATAEAALASKRALGKIGYGAREEFKLTKNPVAGDYGAGVRQMERGVDSALDATLGPQFEQANTLVRILGGAKQAAERAAARTTGNNILGLLPYLAGLTGAATGHASGHGTPAAALSGLAALLAGKYGAQVGARALYGTGAVLKLSPEILSLLGESAPAAQASIKLRSLLGAGPEFAPAPAFATRGGQ